jgi:hypothetical protein
MLVFINITTCGRRPKNQYSLPFQPSWHAVGTDAFLPYSYRFIATTAESEAAEKEKWHRRHRREERARLKSDVENYIALSHREHSASWTMDKDGKKYWGTAPGSKHMGQ